MRPAPRSRAQRSADTLALLRTEVDCWEANEPSGRPLMREGVWLPLDA